MASDLDLNLLTVFDALVQESSVTSAAERLHLSAPATSRALARLRRAMDDPILVRAGRGLTPTPYALRVAPRVRSVLEEAHALVSEDRSLDPATLERTFTIRVNDGVTAILATTLAESVATDAPGVTLRFVGEGDEDPETLRDGSVDVSIIGRRSALGLPPDLHSDPLYIDRLVGIVRQDSPLGRHRRPTLRQLCRHPHISASRRGLSRGPLDDVLEEAGLHRHVAVVVPSFAAAALLVASSDYVGLVPQRFAEFYGRALGLRWFDIPADLPQVQLYMLWHARLEADPAHRWLRDAIRTVAV